MKYRLKAAHHTREGRMLDAGTIVGDGCQYPAPDPPTPDMEPLDGDARARIREEYEWDHLNQRLARRR